ncbi:hypothetical protein pb186bvf_017218 [Paramecium bursaria]
MNIIPIKFLNLRQFFHVHKWLDFLLIQKTPYNESLINITVLKSNLQEAAHVLINYFKQKYSQLQLQYSFFKFYYLKIQRSSVEGKQKYHQFYILYFIFQKKNFTKNFDQW